MFKKLLEKLGRVIFIITYIIFFVIAVSATVVFLIQTKRYNDLNNDYQSLKNNLSQSNSDTQSQVGNLSNTNNELKDQITKLQDENNILKTQLENFNKTGYGEIDGKISGQIIVGGNSNVSQYQLVCAENVNNRNLEYCMSVSSLTQNFSLMLPQGTYQVSARVLANDKTLLTNYKAYYTDYIKCINSQNSDQCDTTKLSKVITNVEVKSGSKVANINPIDWSSSTPSTTGQ